MSKFYAFLSVGTLLLANCAGFLSPAPRETVKHATSLAHNERSRAAHLWTHRSSLDRTLGFQLASSASPNENDSESESSSSSSNSSMITREMFQRELLQDPVVKRSKGKSNKSGYKVLDNRDSLPFRVEQVTPDPYTHPDIKKKKMKKVPRRPGTIEEGLLSSVYSTGSNNDNNDDKTMVGEFMLDKHTTSGDLLEIGDVQYRVVRHKCQYKYAGGQRFVMARKILQVKEVGRVYQEEYLTRQWESSPSTENL